LNACGDFAAGQRRRTVKRETDVAAEGLGAKRSLVRVITGISCVSMAMGPLGGSLAMLIGLRLLPGRPDAG